MHTEAASAELHSELLQQRMAGATPPQHCCTSPSDMTFGVDLPVVNKELPRAAIELSSSLHFHVYSYCFLANMDTKGSGQPALSEVSHSRLMISYYLDSRTFKT